jgi:serine/threonine protein kinase
VLEQDDNKNSNIMMIPTFSFDQFVTQKVLGSGSFSRVYLVHLGHTVSFDECDFTAPEYNEVEWKTSSFALKCPMKSEEDDGESMILRTSQLKDEAKLLAELQHPNIVQLRALPRDESCPFLGYFFVMDCLSTETLQYRIKTTMNRVCIRDRIQNICLGIAAAMKHCHSKGIEVRDLKPDNIGFDEKTGQVRIFDFGLARRVNTSGESQHDSDAELAGSLRYMSPEAMLGKSCQASDVYSFGLVLWELITLMKPYFEVQRKFQRKRKSGDLAAHLVDLVTNKNELPGPMWHVRSKDIRKIITSCCQYDPSCRPTFDEIEKLLMDVLEVLEDRSSSSISLKRRLSFGHNRVKGPQLWRSLSSPIDDSTSNQTASRLHTVSEHNVSHRLTPSPSSVAPMSVSEHGARYNLASLMSLSGMSLSKVSKSSPNIRRDDLKNRRKFSWLSKRSISFGSDDPLGTSQKSSISWVSKQKNKVVYSLRRSSMSDTETEDCFI